MKLCMLFFLMLLLPKMSNAMIHHRLHQEIDKTIDNLEKNKEVISINHSNAYFLEDEASVAEAVDCHCCIMTAAVTLCSNNQIAKSAFAISTLIFSTDLLLTSLKKWQLKKVSKEVKDKELNKYFHHHQD